MSMRLHAALVLAVAAIHAAPEASAQNFPTGPVRIVVSTGPGAAPDVLTRIVADHLTRHWNQQVVVMNRPGGAGAVAIRSLADAPADGHTVYLSLASNYIALPELQKNFPVDVVRDFVPIGFVGGHPMVIAAGESVGVKTLPELVALAKQRKGELNIGAGNRGSTLHFTGEWLRQSTGIDVTLLHYAGSAQTITDVLGGRLHAMIDSFTAMRGAVDSGKLKPLAIATRERQPQYPGLATFAETIPGFEATGWLALMAPPGTPKPVADKFSADLRAMLAKPEVQQRYRELGSFIRPMTPDELVAFIQEQVRIWRPVIAETAKTFK
ncbi:MAG: tripartite tricarboxylate transporter substrate binding protein [Alphaproteobacteria bacterium]|nr:tripartite tricarboxylate transporter substrate binding protein [Alphaproteobacteria bacterium]